MNCEPQTPPNIIDAPGLGLSRERIIKRLSSAELDEELRAHTQAQAEDEIERIILQHFRVQDEAIEKLIKTIQEKEQVIEQQKQALEAKYRALEEKQQAFEQRKQAIEAKDQALEETDRELAARRAELERLNQA